MGRPSTSQMVTDLMGMYENLDGWERSVVRVIHSALDCDWVMSVGFVTMFEQLWDDKVLGRLRLFVVDPLSTTPENTVPIQSALRTLAAQEGCDGTPYDQMQQAADHIDELERKVYELVRKHQDMHGEMCRLHEVAVELLSQLSKTDDYKT